ncbi:MAG: autotransporter outer membrane beta-barrel domain-containing protein [Caulobacterales bacterium]|nr:autotransporter outer membrane beta-barrel domain-containing protein [Caulobacterales bacterium]
MVTLSARRGAFALLICVSIATATGAWAQVAPSPKTGALITAAQGNPQFQSTAAYIGALCPNLTPGTDLRLRCAGALNASTDAPPLATIALGSITPEELLSQSGAVDGAIAPATNAVAGRLSALGRVGFRGGVAALYRPVALASNGDTAGVGGFSPSRLQGFFNVSGGSGNRDHDTYEAGYDFDQGSITGGGDYRFSDAFTAGVSLSYGKTDVNFDASGGKMHVKTTAGAAYGLWSVSDRLQISGLISYGHVRYSSYRNISYVESATSVINRVAYSKARGHQWEGTVTATYALPASDGWSFGPSLALSAATLHLKAFDETGAGGLDLSFPTQTTKSLQVILGFDASKAISAPWGVVTPYGRAQAIYETKDDRRTVAVRYTADTTGFFPGIRLNTSAPDRTRFLLGGGLAGQFASGWSAFADVETVVGLRYVSGYDVTIGGRKEF